MRTDYNTGKAQKTSRVNCSICVRSFHDSLVGPCPERDGRQVCMYCCRLCGNSYKGFMGWGCRVKDAVRAAASAGRRKNLSTAARSPSPEGEARA